MLPASTDVVEINDGNIRITHDQKHLPVYYSKLPRIATHPKIGHASAGIDIPVPVDISLHPNEVKTIDTGLQFYVPANFYMQLMPRSSSFKCNVHIHHGVIDNDFASTVKLLIRNISNDLVTIPQGTALVQGLIIPVIHPHLMEAKSIHISSKRGANFLGSSDTQNTSNRVITLSETPVSPIHDFLGNRCPLSVNIPELNTNVLLPQDLEENVHMSFRLSEFNKIQNSRTLHELAPPMMDNHCPHEAITDFTRQLVDRKAYLNATISADQPVLTDKQKAEIKQQLHSEMCQKLAIISVDLIKNQAMTANLIAKSQEGDDIFSTMRENINTNRVKEQGYVILNQVLYKKFKLPHTNVHKYALCIPSILLPAVIHQMHVILGHPTHTTMVKNFRHYYYHPHAKTLIRDFVQSCTTCALAHKHDIQKVTPSVVRTMQPDRPRQHLYADLIPMFKGTFSYILFALDAYSQYIYAIPIKNKSAEEVLQGFLAIFGTTGWYENIYLDNETSFVKAAKLLVKTAPIKIHYSTPYCHFQNSAENYIKNFKKTFLKIVNDQQSPQENADWPLLLPTVTQALNRQVIPHLGMSRETLHYNTPVNFYPLAEINNEANLPFDETAINATTDNFQKILINRRKHQAYSRKAPVPHFTKNAMVFVRDQAPSVSTVLKIPQRGPFRIEKVEDRNVTLIDIETGKTVRSHVELIRPLNISEFKMFLNKDWDLNTHNLKANEPISQPGIFRTPSNPMTLDEVLNLDAPEEVDDEIDLERLFYPSQPVKNTLQPENPPSQAQQPPQNQTNEPNAKEEQESDQIDLRPQPLSARLHDENIDDIEDEFMDETMQFNSLNVKLDISKEYKTALQPERLVSFYLTKKDQYIKI